MTGYTEGDYDRMAQADAERTQEPTDPATTLPCGCLVDKHQLLISCPEHDPDPVTTPVPRTEAGKQAIEHYKNAGWTDDPDDLWAYAQSIVPQIEAQAATPATEGLPKDYAQMWLDGGADPTFDQIDGFLLRHYNARAVYAEAAAPAPTGLLGCYGGQPHRCSRCGVDIAAAPAPAGLDTDNEWCNCDDPAGWHTHGSQPPAPAGLDWRTILEAVANTMPDGETFAAPEVVAAEYARLAATEPKA